MRKSQDENQGEATRSNVPTGLIWIIGQLARLPVAAFNYGMDMIVKTMQEVQRVADQSVDVISGNTETQPGTCGAERPGGNDEIEEIHARSHRNFSNQTEMPGVSANSTDSNSTAKEIRVMDKDMHDDMLKLVRYKVLFVKREYEHAFPEREDLVSDNMDGSAFTAWKTAEFIQELKRGGTGLPTKWREKGYPRDEFRKNGDLTGLPDEDKKYLRVYYEVLERYPREKFKYEEQQIRVLEEIRDKLP